MASKRTRASCGLAALAATALLLAGCGPTEPTTTGAPVKMRRLTEDQYRNSIVDIFGADITVPGRFEPILRPHFGLVATAASRAAVSPTGFEQYFNMAQGIATQVLAPGHREMFLPCAPASANAPDEACSRRFFAIVGRLLFRRPLTERELAVYVEAARASTDKVSDFYRGLGLGLEAMLVAPDFLYLVEVAEPAPGKPSHLRLDGWSKAARLSYLLWNTTPDELLLTAAERGELDDAEGMARQVDRLIASPRIRDGVRAFFADMLDLQRFDSVVKDPVIYPKFVRLVAADTPEQLIRTITHHVVDENRDYRDLFTTRATFMTRALGAVYNVPVAEANSWQPYDFAPEGERAGIHTLLEFLSAFSHDGRSSATLRGKAIRELLLCQPVPDPPSTVNFNLVQDTGNPLYKTARSRLSAHSNDAACAGCHKITDPIGLALENFDGIGAFRKLENGAPIDTAGELNGVSYADAKGLGAVLRNDPAVTACVARRAVEYAIGRPLVSGEQEWLDFVVERFAGEKFRFLELLRVIASSEAPYRIAEAASVASAAEE